MLPLDAKKRWDYPSVSRHRTHERDAGRRRFMAPSSSGQDTGLSRR